MVTKRQRDLVSRVRAAEREAEALEWEPFPGVVYRSEFREGAGIGGHGQWHVVRDLVVNGRVVQMTHLGLPFGKTKHELEAHMQRMAEGDWVLNKPAVLSLLYRHERRPLRTPDNDPQLEELERLYRVMRVEMKRPGWGRYEEAQHELRTFSHRLRQQHYSSDELNAAVGPDERFR